MLDLRPFIERDLDEGVLRDWDRAQYEAFVTPEGARYGVPKYHGALALYYNKDLFDAHGVSYPDDTWTQDEYLDAMRQLTLDTDDDGGTDVLGRHDRCFLGPSADPSERMGRESCRPRGPVIMCHGRASRDGCARVAACSHVGRQGDGDVPRRPEPLDS